MITLKNLSDSDNNIISNGNCLVFKAWRESEKEELRFFYWSKICYKGMNFIIIWILHEILIWVWIKVMPRVMTIYLIQIWFLYQKPAKYYYYVSEDISCKLSFRRYCNQWTYIIKWVQCAINKEESPNMCKLKEKVLSS